MRTNNKTNVYWCHSHFLNWLGGSNYIYEVTSRLKDKYNMTVVASFFSKNNLKKFRSSGFKTIELNTNSTNSFWYWLFLKNNIRLESLKLASIVKPGDIVITSMFPMNCIAMQLNNKHIQCVWEPYSLFYDKNYISGFNWLQRIFIFMISFFYRGLDLTATRKSDRVITLSRFTKRWIKDIYGRDDAVVSYEGVDINFFKKTHNRFLENKYKNDLVVLHATDFTATKGTKYLVEAFPEVLKVFPNAKLLICSTINNFSEKRKYLRFAEENNFSKRIRFLGRVSYKLLPSYYSLAKVLVQPSIKQNMSLPVKEAMACGTPIITLREGWEQTSNGEAGYLVNSKNPKAITKAIVKIFSDKKLSSKMGESGRKIVSNRFSWNKVAAVFDQEITSLALTDNF